MNRTIRVLLVMSFVLVSAHAGLAWSWRRNAKSASPHNSVSPAAAVLSAIEADPSAGRVVLRTSATPVYTSYSPQPDVFVIDLTGVSKASALVAPSELPSGMLSVAADEVVEMGSHLTRVTMRFAQPQTPQASSSDNSVVITIPVSALADGAATAAPSAPAVVSEPEPVRQTANRPVASEPISAQKAATPLQKATTLRSVDTKGSGTSLEVTLATNGDTAFKAFRLDKPARIVLDLTGVNDGLKTNTIAVGDPLVKRIRVSQFKGAPDPVTRVVLDLDEKVDYRVIKEGDRLKIAFGAAVATTAAPPVAAPTTAATPAEPAAIAAESHPAASGSTVSVAASVSASGSSARPAKAAADIPSQVPTIAPAVLEARISEDSAKPPTHVISAPVPQSAPVAPSRKATNAAKSAVSAASAAAATEDVFNDAQATTGGANAPQLGGKLAAAGSRTLSSNEKVYTGEPISLNLKEADMKDVLRTFAQLTGLNIAVDPGVGGAVTVEFNEVPWDQALELILRQNGLTYVVEGNVMRVGRLDTLAREAEQTRKLAEDEKLNVPMQTVSFKLSYAKAADVQGLLREMASPRAKMIVDMRTNQLVISEIPQYLQTMKNLIDSVDVPTPQVLIEARIVETTKTFLQQYGITWGFNGVLNPGLGTGTGLVFPYSGTIKGGPFDFASGTPILDTHFMNVLGTFDLDMLLAASEAETLVKIVSAPRVTTQDNQQAEIESGTQIPYQTRVNFTTTISYVAATLRLSVTPQITEQGTVIMEIQVSKNEPGAQLEGAGGPSISTRRAQTKLMVRDGGTAVIGGIYQASDTNSQNRIPFLHQIPFVGSLFKNHNISSRHDELLIFITPRIVRNS